MKIGVLIHQENAPAHKSMIAVAAVLDYGYELVNHPSYSHDLPSIATTDSCARCFFLMKQFPFRQLSRPF